MGGRSSRGREKEEEILVLCSFLLGWSSTASYLSSTRPSVS